MTQQTFGNRLAEARRKRGLTLDQVHLQLRISPAILEALETADFRHMPLKGHARNMVSSYARYLGLDPEEITEQFLSEYHDFEQRQARDSLTSFGSGVPPSGHIETNPLSSARPGKTGEGQGVRSMWDQPIPSSELNRGYDSRSSSAQRVANAASRRTRAKTAHDDRLAGRSGSGSYISRPSLPARLFGAVFKSPVALIVALIAVIVVLFVVWALAANSCKKQEREKEVIPINTGVVVEEPTPSDGTDTSTGTDAGSGETGEDDSRYGPFELAVEPAVGQAPWTEVTVDGERVLTEALSERKAWQVTTSCTVSTAQPGNLTVTRNGETVALEADSSSGMSSVTLEVETKPEGQSGSGGAGATGGTGNAGTGSTDGSGTLNNQNG